VSGSGISWTICKSAPRSRQITTSLQYPTTLFFTGRMPFLPPNQQRQSTEGTVGLSSALIISVQSNLEKHHIGAAHLRTVPLYFTMGQHTSLLKKLPMVDLDPSHTWFLRPTQVCPLKWLTCGSADVVQVTRCAPGTDLQHL